MPEALSEDMHRLRVGAFEQEVAHRTRRPTGTADWLLIMVRQGSGWLGPVQGNRTVQPDEVVLIRPRTPHDYGAAADPGHWTIAFAHFHPRAEWHALLDWPETAPGTSVMTLPGQVARRASAAMTEAVRWSRSPLGQQELFALNALESALLWCNSQNPRARQLDERILRVVQYIDSHLAEEIDVGRLARIAHLSVSRLSHLFAEQTDLSPQRYVETQRLNLASQLLELTTEPVSSIARQSGYPDPLYFSTRFRRHTGLSPSQFRHRRRTGTES